MALTIVDEAVEGDTGSGVFVPSFASGLRTLAAGASGTVIPLTPPDGQRVKLNWLSPSAPTQREEGITLEVGGIPLITGRLGEESDPDGTFFVGNHTDTNNASVRSAGIDGITGGVNETINVVKVSGSTAVNLAYSYETGVVK